MYETSSAILMYLLDPERRVFKGILFFYLLSRYDAESISDRFRFFTGDCDDEGTYVNRELTFLAAYSLS